MEYHSPIKRFPGTVILPDYLVPEQVFAIEDAQFAARDYFAANTKTDNDNADAIKPGKHFSFLRMRSLYLPAVLLCVKEWHLENFSINGSGAQYETFPMTPANDVGELLYWLFEELIKIYNGTNDVPNE